MKFTKMHGCGNDYIYVNCFAETISDPHKTAVKVSDRHFGIGSDGLICICPSDKADFRMAMYNADGTEGKMCGNGIRCVAKYVYDYHLTDKTQITVETLSGIKTLDLQIKDGKAEAITVDMGAPILDPQKVPIQIPGCTDPFIQNHPITIVENGQEKEYKITAVSMGNPHGVVYVDNVHNIDIEKIWTRIRKASLFSGAGQYRIYSCHRQNTDQHARLGTWFRKTLACGTGACASVVASVLNGQTDDRVTVHLLGGDLFIHYDQVHNTVYMTGLAAVICDGEITL